MRKVEEEVAWLDKYFFKTEKPASDAVKKGSPLESVLRGNNAKRDESGAFGETISLKVGGAPAEVGIPEVVKRGDVEVARFRMIRRVCARAVPHPASARSIAGALAPTLRALRIDPITAVRAE